MQTDQKIDDKALATIASRFKMDRETEREAANKAFSGKALTNSERNLLIKHIESKQFATKPISMSEMKQAILSAIGYKEATIQSYSYGRPVATNTVSRGELEIIYNFVVKGMKYKETKDEDDE